MCLVFIGSFVPSVPFVCLFFVCSFVPEVPFVCLVPIGSFVPEVEEPHFLFAVRLAHDLRWPDLVHVRNGILFTSQLQRVISRRSNAAECQYTFRSFLTTRLNLSTDKQYTFRAFLTTRLNLSTDKQYTFRAFLTTPLKLFIYRQVKMCR